MSHHKLVALPRPVLLRLIDCFRTGPTGCDTTAALGARTVFSRRQRWMLLVGFALLVIFHLPQAWTHGRFLDEEATVFLAYAWHRPWYDALFRPFAGYWNFAASATTLLVVRLVKSDVLSLEHAPYLTMIMALAVQLLPAVLILTGPARWLSNRLAVVAALLIIATAPATEEVFLNVLHIQFHLALCVALILALDVPQRRISRLGYGALLLLAPLCGPGAIVMLPLVALRTLIDRDVGRLVQLAVLSAGAAVQMLLFYSSSPIRGHLADPVMIAAAIFVRLIALPAFGFDIARGIGAMIYLSTMAGGDGWWCCAAATVAVFGFLIVQAARRRDAAIWLLFSSLAIETASFGFGMVASTSTATSLRVSLFIFIGGRYDFLPLVLLGLSLVVLAMRPRFPGRSVYVSLCLLMVFTGASHYREPRRNLDQGPSWPAEVTAWRRDHHHPLAVWPRPWVADLSDETHPCTPLSRDLSRSTDPRYCESGWVAGFFRPLQTR